MIEEIESILDEIIEIYSSGFHKETLIEAKEEYFKLTGNINEEDVDFDARMFSFYEWYIFQFRSRRGTLPVISDYLQRHPKNDEIVHALKNVRHSLFEFKKINFRKNIVLFDIIKRQKIVIDKNHFQTALIEGDLFTGRVVEYKGVHFLLKGITIYPNEVRPEFIKQSKIVNKKKDPKEELNYLLKLEFLKTKWVRYNHIQTKEIFTFN